MRTRVRLPSARVLTIAFGIWVGPLCQSAFAQPKLDETYGDLNKTVFTKANRGVLCIKEGNRKIVSRVRLAWMLIGAGKAITSIDLLRSANREGIPTGKAEELDGNAIYFVSSSTPFGINREYSEEQKSAANQQLPVLASLLVWLRRGHTLNKEYELVGPPGPPDAERFFQQQSAYEIVCKERAEDGTGGPGGSGNGGIDAWLKNIVVRKTVADIAVSSSELKKANGAQISYNDDQVANKSVFSVEGLVGVVIAGTGADRAQELSTKASGVGSEPRDLYWFKLVPYMYYKSISTNPGSPKDIDYVSPGMTGNLTWVDAQGKFAFDLQLEASGTLDSQNNSNVYNMGIRFSPSFYDGTKVLFGAPIGFGPLYVRPDLALVARHHMVEDAGKNPELKFKDAYTGLGFDASAHFYLATTSSFVSNLVGQVGYIYRNNSDDVVDVKRFFAGLSYVLNTNMTLDLTYVDGRDADTLQEEQRVTLGLSFRN